jgi:site-specific recombinase XerD
MRLSQAVEAYIEYKRSLGMVFRSQAVILRGFVKSQGAIDIKKVPSAATRKFLDGRGPVTHSWFGKYGTLNGFYRFALARHYVRQSPLPSSKPRRPGDFQPYIYSDEDMRSLIEAAKHRRDHRLIEPHTLQVLLLLLYGTGLRISEAINLKLPDFDLNAGVLTIRASKFYKSRFVPVCPDLQDVLRRYIARQWSARGILATTPLLATREATPIARGIAEASFKRLRREACISRPGSPRNQPRLHDFRHTFATVRLVTWYREGMDVQRMLPHLSTYLGHYKIRHTQRYLTMTAELLQEASLCFERYAMPGVLHA